MAQDLVPRVLCYYHYFKGRLCRVGLIACIPLCQTRTHFYPRTRNEVMSGKGLSVSCSEERDVDWCLESLRNIEEARCIVGRPWLDTGGVASALSEMRSRVNIFPKTRLGGGCSVRPVVLRHHGFHRTLEDKREGKLYTCLVFNEFLLSPPFLSVPYPIWTSCYSWHSECSVKVHCVTRSLIHHRFEIAQSTIKFHCCRMEKFAPRFDSLKDVSPQCNNVSVSR